MHPQPPKIIPPFLNGKMVGINISGLLWRKDVGSDNKFELKLSYKRLCIETIKFFIERRIKIVLIPHDYSNTRQFDGDDLTASQDLFDILKKENVKENVFLLNEYYAAYELKWIISQLDFFIGARMHACIAAASSATPFLAFSYSRKFIGLFSSMGFRGPCH